MSYIIRNGAVVSTTLEHYDRISDKPYINNTLLDGVNTSESLGIVWKGTQEEYDALPIKNPNTVYFITDGEAGTEVSIDAARWKLVKTIDRGYVLK